MRFKKVTFFVLLLLPGCITTLCAQKVASTSFFDMQGKLSTLEEAFYFRQTTDTADLYRSYYAHDSSLYFYGKIISAKDSSDQKNIYSGLCTWYYASGYKKKEYNYNEKGITNGTCTDFFENGRPKKIIDHDNGKPNKAYKEYSIKGAYALVYEEDFTDNRNAWLLNANDSGTVKIKIGAIELSSKKNTGIIRSFSRKLNSKNYSIEGVINSSYFSDSTKAGLAFNYKDVLNYSYLIISQHKCYIGEVKDGKEIKKINAFTCYSLKAAGLNTIKVIVKGNALLYSINDEILFSEQAQHTVESSTGLCIKSQGIAFFDKLIIREYQNDLTIEATDAKIKNDNNFMISNKDYGIQSASMGLILNQKGYILCSAINFDRYSQIIVEVFVNDTIKQFLADVVVKSEPNNLAVLKINNLGQNILHDVAYSFYDKPSIELESDLNAIYFTKSDTNNNKPELISGKLKSKARFENLSNHFETSLKTDNISLGCPVFTKQSELLGIITTPSMRNNSKATKLIAIEQLLLFSNSNFKKPKKTSQPNSLEMVSKNIVLIKVK